MEPDDTGLSSYYHPQHHHHPPQPHHNNHHQNPSPTITTTTAIAAVSTAAANGIDRPSAAHMVYTHSVPSAAVAPPLETVRRKRGRPRKYGTPEQAAAAKRLSSSSPSPSSMAMTQHRKKDQSSLPGGSSSATSKKFQLAALGNQGQGFTPHIINVAAGEDVGQKIMVFLQLNKCEICILSASGAISNASLRQPATSGGNITYEGRFDILSLSGSYVHTEHGGRTGGLSVCLASNDGQIIGGGVGGPLIAAGAVQVIVGTFLINKKMEIGTGLKGDASTSKLPSPISGGTPLSSVGFLSAIDDSGRIVTSDDHQTSGASQFMMSRGMQLTSPRSTDWRGSTDSRSSGGFDFSGRMGHGAHQSPENNGDYDQFQD